MINKMPYILLKILLSLIFSFVLLTIFCLYYYNTPVHITQNNGVTDYKWIPNSKWMRMTEGISSGKVDSNGYNNVQIPDSLNILILGSSHMEAMEVNQNENMSTLLQSNFGNRNVYNIGISGHTLYRCISNLDRALQLYKPSDYFIIETDRVKLDEKDINIAITGNYEKLQSIDSGLVFQLQKNPFLRLFRNQIKDLFFTNRIINSERNNRIDEKVKNTLKIQSYYSSLFKYIKKESDKFNVKPIIFYHPTLISDLYGNLILEDDYYLELFKKGCIDNGIIFVDMTEPFVEGYKEEKVFPKGFITGSVNTGHLNKFGHSMIAEKLYQVINEIENKERP